MNGSAGAQLAEQHANSALDSLADRLSDVEDYLVMATGLKVRQHSNGR